jgi:hypothetical protein
VYFPRPGVELAAVPIIFIGTQRVSTLRACGALTHTGVKGEVSRRLGLAHAAFNTMGKQGIWTDKTPSRRTKFTIYKATVLTILLYCVKTWSVGPADLIMLETAQIRPTDTTHRYGVPTPYLWRLVMGTRFHPLC